jgi:peptidoglycan/xylan/chitin deacetylase (PgdA/CDA1 family)
MSGGKQSRTNMKKVLVIASISTLILITLLIVFMAVGCSHVTHGIVSIAASSFPGTLYFVQTEKKLVALTIDDGPDPETTLEILEILEHHHAKATFFLISSYVSGNKKIVTQIVSQGHELGNHMTHDEPSIKLSHSDFVAKFNEADKVLSEFSEIRWFRPGSGWYNSTMIQYLANDKRGYRCVLGSVYPFDATIPSPSFATNYILWNVKSGDIIILHDRGKRGKRTVQTLKRILPEFNRRGYKVVSLTELYSDHFGKDGNIQPQEQEWKLLDVVDY